MPCSAFRLTRLPAAASLCRHVGTRHSRGGHPGRRHQQLPRRCRHELAREPGTPAGSACTASCRLALPSPFKLRLLGALLQRHCHGAEPGPQPSRRFPRLEQVSFYICAVESANGDFYTSSLLDCYSLCQAVSVPAVSGPNRPSSYLQRACTHPHRASPHLGLACWPIKLSMAASLSPFLSFCVQLSTSERVRCQIATNQFGGGGPGHRGLRQPPAGR